MPRLVLLLLLGSLRGGLVVALAIPLSMLFAFCCMLASGISGNLMSLGAIDFGLIVDGSVVMVENIVRRLAQRDAGTPILQSIRRAAIEVGRPVTFAVAIIIIVYLPILTLTGTEGRMFRPMAWTVVFALMGALLLSLTVMPVLASSNRSSCTTRRRSIHRSRSSATSTGSLPFPSVAITPPSSPCGTAKTEPQHSAPVPPEPER